MMYNEQINVFGEKNYLTVCPGSSDPPEKILNIFASEMTTF